MPAHPKKVVRVYYELDSTYYSLTSTTFVGTLMKSLGLVSEVHADEQLAAAALDLARQIAAKSPIALRRM